MGSRSKLNPMRSVQDDDWQYLRLVLAMYDLVVDDHPCVLARELFDEALPLVRLRCGENM
jgi:hypothetical protein